MHISTLFDWFAGDGRYMNLVHCMGHDHGWIALTIVLDLTVAAGYAAIAMHWWKNQRTLPAVPAKRALGNMRNIFLFCGLCGYVFIPVKMVWPAWRLYDMFMVVLAYFTWRYAWGARDLKVLYTELGRSSRLAADLEQSRQESAERTFFLNAVSHDLRTPLNGLVLQTHLAEMSVAGGDMSGAKEALAEIKATAQAASRLLEGLIDYAHMGVKPPTTDSIFPLEEGVRDVVERFRSRANDKGLTLQMKVPPTLRVRLDRAKFDRILLNLLDNALKFTEAGGVRVEVESDGIGVEVHVLDTGVGVAPEHHGRLFEEFFQVDNAGRDHSKGFGLGLAIVRSLARQMGGDVALESVLGGGSRFSVVFPNAVARQNDAGSALASVGVATRPAATAGGVVSA